MERKELIRTIYLYLFSLVGLVLITIGTVRLVNLGLKTFIFKKADQPIVYPSYPRAVEPVKSEGQVAALTPEEEEKYRQDQEEFEKKNKESQRQRTAAESLAMIIVGTPIFLYHWKVIQKGKDKSLEISN